LVAGGSPGEPKLINTCYSLVAPDYGISIVGVYRPADGQIKEVEGSAGVSPLDAPSSTRALEATFANDWFKTITNAVFGCALRCTRLDGCARRRDRKLRRRRADCGATASLYRCWRCDPPVADRCEGRRGTRTQYRR